MMQSLDGEPLARLDPARRMRGCRCFSPARAGSDYDPTNSISAGFDLIPVAVARHPGQAIPLVGSWFGDAKDYLGMSVDVVVRKIADFRDPPKDSARQGLAVKSPQLEGVRPEGETQARPWRPATRPYRNSRMIAPTMAPMNPAPPPGRYHPTACPR